MILLLCLLIGVVAGLRALLAPTIVSWAAQTGHLSVGHAWPAFLGYRYTPYVFTVLAIAELVADKLPKTPSRKVIGQFAPRLLSGGLSGAALGAAGGALWAGLVLGVIGALLGTLGGYEARRALAGAFKRDLPAALIEDVVAIALAVVVVGQV